MEAISARPYLKESSQEAFTQEEVKGQRLLSSGVPTAENKAGKGGGDEEGGEFWNVDFQLCGRMGLTF